jgi:hypothetical protein
MIFVGHEVATGNIGGPHSGLRVPTGFKDLPRGAGLPLSPFKCAADGLILSLSATAGYGDKRHPE